MSYGFVLLDTNLLQFFAESTLKNKSGQVRDGLAHEGFRTIIHKNGKKPGEVILLKLNMFLAKYGADV